VTRHMRLAAALVVALVGVAGCGDDKPASGSGGGGGGAKKIKVGFSQANNGDVWRINQTNKVKEFCGSWAEVVVTDGQGKDDKQATDVDDLINQKVDILLLTPNTSAALTPAAKKAMDAKIPVITLDRGVETDVTQHIGADNKLIGKTAAKFVAETLLKGQPGKVIEIQGTLGASATTDRNKEFHATLASDYPNVKVIDEGTGKYKREDALSIMNDMLGKYNKGDFDVVYTHNDEMALGAVQALKTAGRLQEAKVVGIDGQNEAIAAIKTGEIAATFTYDNAGKEACESAKKLLVDKGALDKSWVLPTNQIDATNVEQWVGKGF
jgi:ribose transport system substrate-binding protein